MAEETKSNIPEFSVSEISTLLKRTVEDAFPRVRVRAELSGLRRHGSGHMYFSLKDDKAVLSGVMWKGLQRGLTFRPEDGLEVVATGKLSTYAGQSRYQLVVERMEPAGEGALMALLEERRRKLAAEGLFAAERKKPRPFLPGVIGVVSSPTGAVIRDILHRLQDRFPRHVILWPVPVQGEGAAEKIAAAIRGFNAGDGSVFAKPDLLIVARGGGSLEDLWAFNEEVVVRAAADSTIPLISAVGHETDTTLIDHAADVRAPTPTAAAEMAVPVRADLVADTGDAGVRLMRAAGRMVRDGRDRLAGLVRGLPRPADILGMASQRLDDLSGRLPVGLMNLVRTGRAELGRLAAGLSPRSLATMVAHKRERFTDRVRRLARPLGQTLKEKQQGLAGLSRLLESFSYQAVLSRGFAVVYDAGGRPLTAAGDIAAGDALDIEFRDGHVEARAGGTGPVRKQKPAAKKKSSKKPKSGDRQGRLL